MISPAGMPHLEGRVHPEGDLRHLPCLTGDAVKGPELIQGVHRDPDPFLHCEGEVGVALRGAVEEEPVGVHPRLEGEEELPRGEDIGPCPLAGKGSQDGRVPVRLRRVEDPHLPVP
jgi:hypothetical protein